MPDKKPSNLETEQLCFKSGVCYPAEGKTIRFFAGVISARKIDVNKHSSRGSSSHRAYTAKIDDCEVYVDKDWCKKQK